MPTNPIGNPAKLSVITYAFIAIILIGILSLGYIFFIHKAATDSTACSTKNLKVAAFGDSLVAGYGATQGNDFPSLLSKTIGVPVSNFGESGDTTADALARINNVISAKPDVVIVLLGGNDALQKVPQAITKQNLSTIIDTFQKANIQVVLVGVLGGIPTDPYAPMFLSLAQQYKVVSVSNILSGLIGNSNLMSDEVHPNDAGYVKVAVRIAPAVEKACSLK